MADENLSVADIAAVTRPYGGYGYGGYGMNGFGMGFEWIFIFALFAMMGGGFGGFGGWGGYGGAGLGLADGGLLGYAIGNNATKSDLSDGLNSVQTMNKLDNISSQMVNGIYGTQAQISNGISDLSSQICQGFNSTNINNLQGFNATQRELLQGFNSQNVLGLQNTAAIQQTLNANRFADQQCCCETQKQIAAQTAENFRNTCDVVNAINADGEKTRAILVANKVADLEEKLAESRRATQTAQIIADNQAQTNTLVNALRPTPIPAYASFSPYQTLEYSIVNEALDIQIGRAHV